MGMLMRAVAPIPLTKVSAYRCQGAGDDKRLNSAIDVKRAVDQRHGNHTHKHRRGETTSPSTARWERWRAAAVSVPLWHGRALPDNAAPRHDCQTDNGHQ